MDDSTIKVDIVWAATTDTIINWAIALMVKELLKTLEYLKLTTEGEYMTLRWRLLRWHQHCRHMHVTWEESGERN